MEKEFQRKIPVKHHCLSHRLDLVTDETMKVFPVFGTFEKCLKEIFTFYHVSHKRQNSLNTFVQELQEPQFRLSSIFDVRWISSFKIAIDKIRNNYFGLVSHLDHIFENVRDFTTKNFESFELKVGLMADFLGHKDAMALMYFNYDIVSRFSIESQYTQRKGATLIGMGKRRRIMIHDLKQIKQLQGPEFKSFLDSCQCFNSQAEAVSFIQTGNPVKKCSSLEEYEAHSHIVFKKTILEDTDLRHQDTDALKFTPISSLIPTYVDKLISEVNNYMPSDEIEVFDPLDQSKWQLKSTRWKIPNVRNLAKLFAMNQDLIQNQFNQFLRTMLANSRWFCNHKNNDPAYFWSLALNNFNPGLELASFMRRILSIPMGEFDTYRVTQIKIYSFKWLLQHRMRNVYFHNHFL